MISSSEITKDNVFGSKSYGVNADVARVKKFVSLPVYSYIHVSLLKVKSETLMLINGLYNPEFSQVIGKP